LLDTHRRTDRLGERPADERRGDECADDACPIARPQVPEGPRRLTGGILSRAFARLLSGQRTVGLGLRQRCGQAQRGGVAP
jgi:hypothetical protein